MNAPEADSLQRKPGTGINKKKDKGGNNVKKKKRKTNCSLEGTRIYDGPILLLKTPAMKKEEIDTMSSGSGRKKQFEGTKEMGKGTLLSTTNAVSTERGTPLRRSQLVRGGKENPAPSGTVCSLRRGENRIQNKTEAGGKNTKKKA